MRKKRKMRRKMRKKKRKKRRKMSDEPAIQTKASPGISRIRNPDG